MAGEDAPGSTDRAYYKFGRDALSTSVIAARYFDLPFPERAFNDLPDWFDIPTPNFDRILDYQEFEPAVQRWMFVFIGRLIYPLNEHDAWQVIPFLKGTASSGKSTLINVAKQLFDPVDVGTMSNNIEKKFGLSAFADKYIFLAPEIKADLQMEQADVSAPSHPGAGRGVLAGV